MPTTPPRPAHPPVLETATPLSQPARPELTEGVRVGVLLSHGFTGSPGSMRAWGESLAARGFGVEVPRLPGHGTTWQDMNTTTFEEWYAEIAATYQRLRAENDVVVAGGLSMGGALVLRLAEEHGDGLAGLIVVNPAVASGRKDALLLPLVKHLVGAFPGIASDIKRTGVVESAYSRTPLKAAHTMFKAWPAIVRDLGRITVPLLYFRSTVDHVVDGLSEPLILEGVSSKDITFTPLTDSYHVATVDNDAQQIFDESAAFIRRVCGLGAGE
ncbi:MAG: alpha/beta fold hydrolase [Nocardioides sp.]|uniref:alpha/beta hydrolase n=1 Tax=Nocardioides sp. TaxID=35761 RepID=UPI0039E2FF5C